MLRRLLSESIVIDFTPAQESPRVHADAGMLEQALVEPRRANARDAMAPGRPPELQGGHAPCRQPTSPGVAGPTRRLRVHFRQRHWLRDTRRGAAEDLRPLLHDEGRGTGHRTRTCHGEGHCQAPRRVDRRGDAGRRRLDLPDPAAGHLAKNIQVIGNGDVFDAGGALRMFETTGCDAILLSRGTMGQPWIIEDIYRALEGLPPIERTQEHYHRAFIEHFHHIAAYQSQRRALLDLRRISCWYFKKEHGAKNMRETFQKFQSIQEVQEWIPTLQI